MAHKYTTNIPLARTRLKSLAQGLAKKGLKKEANEILSIVEDIMTRRPGPRRAPSTRSEVTPKIRKSVIHDLKTTKLPQEDIAKKHNIDGGRVSEIYRTVRN